MKQKNFRRPKLPLREAEINHFISIFIELERKNRKLLYFLWYIIFLCYARYLRNSSHLALYLEKITNKVVEIGLA